MTASFVVYDWVVQRRNRKLIKTAARSNAVVTSMFPDEFRDRILGQQQSSFKNRGTTRHLEKFLKDGDGLDNDYEAQPIADLFLNTTISK